MLTGFTVISKELPFWEICQFPLRIRFFKINTVISETSKIVKPGETKTYTFTVPIGVEPGADDRNCIPCMYHSAANRERDVNTGLIGPVLICREGKLDCTTDREVSYVRKTKRQKDCLWKQGTHYGSENGSLGFTETLHRQ